MTQMKKMLRIMLTNKNKKIWEAKDFQQFGEWFIGYEASARMSDLVRIYPDLFIVGKNGRFRTLEINWDYEEINDLIKMLEE